MSQSPEKQGSLRVAMVSRRVHPAHGPGGLERHVFELVTELAARGVKIDLYSETPSDKARLEDANRSFSSVATTHWVPPGRLPIGTRKGTVVLDRITNYFMWSRRVARSVLRELGPFERCLLHVHGLAGWGLAVSDQRHKDQVPLIVTTHGLEEFQSHVALKRWLYFPFRRGMVTVANRSDVVVTTDESLRSVVCKHLGVHPSDQVVIPNAINPEASLRVGSVDYGYSLLSRYGREDVYPLFLSVGRVEANKGFEVLVSALALAAEELPESWAWILVGAGPEQKKIQNQIRAAGLASHCILTGRLNDRELHSLYRVADWFVHPTLYEGSSLVTLDAMAHQLPVIASRTGGLPDKIIDEVSGFLVSPGEAGELASRLVDACAVDGKSFGLAGQERCKAKFSWDVVVPQYLELYKSLLAS